MTGGAGNIGTPASQDLIQPVHLPGAQKAMPEAEEPFGKESDEALENERVKAGVSHLGLADKLKYGLLGMVKKH